MENTDLGPLMEDLRDSVDELETALAPLVRSPHSEITSKLPLLDKAKVSVLTTYAIESILFSVLKLNGVDAKQHPIFTELTRVKQYFEKIKDAENGGPVKRANMKLNAPAANRFIKAALAGNDKFDKERVQRQVEERQGARKRLHDLDDASARPKKRKLATDPAVPFPSSELQQNEHEVPDDAMPERTEANGDADSSTAKPYPADLSLDDEEAREKKRLKRERKDQKRQDRERGDNGNPRKVKSSKPPRDNKTIFNDLLGRQDGKKV